MSYRYNIYRNGNLLNDRPVTETSYYDTNPEEENEYKVRAVYDRGEAAASNPVTVGFSGIESVLNDIDPTTVLFIT